MGGLVVALVIVFAPLTWSSSECTGVSSSLLDSECDAWITVHSAIKSISKFPCLLYDPCACANIISCESGRMRQMNFGYSPATAPPSQLGLLTSLTHLSFGRNNYESDEALPVMRLPSELGLLTELTYLALDHFNAPTLPSQLALLSRLRVLSVSGNQLTSLPIASAWANTLQKLRARDNPLFPYSDITQLTRLHTLDLHSTQPHASLSPALPSQIGSLTLLERLDVSGNTLSSLPSQIGCLHRMQHLWAEHNTLSTLPSQLSSLSTLQTANFGFNSFPTVPSVVFQLTSMSDLGLGSNPFTQLPSTIGLLSNLDHLDLSGTGIGTLPTSMAQLSALNAIALSHTHLTTIPNALNSIFRHMLDIALDHTRLSSLSPDFLSGLSGALTVSFQHNRLTSLPSEIGTLTNIELLDLRNNKLSNIPSQITLLSTLRFIQLDNNRLLTVPQLPVSIEVVSLGQNRLREFPLGPSLLPELTDLELEHNEMVGHIPALDLLYPKLIVVTLHGNRISGPLPSLPSTTNIATFHDNLFQGTVPHSLVASITQGPPSPYRVLTVAGNHLSCDLPRLDTQGDVTIKTFVAPGNAFNYHESADRLWVSHSETDAHFLFVMPGLSWTVIQILFAGVSCLLVAFAYALWHSRTVESPAEFRRLLFYPNHSNPFMVFQHLCLCVAGTVAGCAVVLTLPMYTVKGSLYDCGHVLGSLSIAYYTQSGWDEALGCVACVHSLVLVMALLWLRRESLVRHLIFENNTPTGMVPSEQYHTQHILSFVLRFVVWVVGLCALNVPVAAHILLHSLPLNNTLGVSPLLSSVFLATFPIILVAVSNIAIPALCSYVVRGTHAPQSTELALLLASVWVVIIALPIVTVFLFDDSCHQMWHIFWLPCVSGGNDFDIENFFNPDKMILTTEEVCTRRYRTGMCARRIVLVVSDILTNKLSVLCGFLPAITLLLAMASVKHGVSSATRRGRVWAWVRTHVARVATIDRRVSVQTLSLVQIAFVFGFLSPPIAVLVVAVLWVNYVVRKLMVAEGWVVAPHHGRIPLGMLGACVVLHIALVVWVWVDSSLGGAKVLGLGLGILALIGCGVWVSGGGVSVKVAWWQGEAMNESLLDTRETRSDT